MDLSTVTQDYGVFTAQVNFHSASSPFMSGIYNLLDVLWVFFLWHWNQFVKAFLKTTSSADQPLL